MKNPQALFEAPLLPLELWARRGSYALRGQRLLMHELLLPEPPPC